MHLYIGIGMATRQTGSSVHNEIEPFTYLGRTQEEADGFMFGTLQRKYPSTQGFSYSGKMYRVADGDVRAWAAAIQEVTA